MTDLFILFVLLIAIAFLFYGINCLRSEYMKSEFLRFGLSHEQRRLTGVLQILGGIGLLSGLVFPPLGLASSGGLSLLMILGFLVRVKIRDSFLEKIPALVLALINVGLFMGFLRLL